MAQPTTAGAQRAAAQSREQNRRPQATTDSPAAGVSTPGFPGSSHSRAGGGPNLLGLEADEWRAPPAPGRGEPQRPQLVPDEPDYEPAPPELLEWTPERAGAIFRGAAFVLHKADGLHHEPGGEELWRATAGDVDAIAPPLARILNRYAPARRLAGVTDEAELAFGVVGYVRDNMAQRGRLVAAKREREEEGPAVWTADDARA